MLSHISEARVEIDYILLCETFLNNDSTHLFELPNYNLIYKKTEILILNVVFQYIFLTVFSIFSEKTLAILKKVNLNPFLLNPLEMA